MKLSKLLLISLFSAFTTISAVPSQATEERIASVSVNGTGTMRVAPDMAIITAGVVKEAATAREALDANNAAMQTVLAEMKQFGIAEKDLQTSGFNIQPRYFYPKRKTNGEQPAPKITGYLVSNNLTIRILKLELTGEVLDRVVTLGVNTGGNIRFTNSDTGPILKQARIAAVKDAIDKAQTLVTAAGKELGDIIQISENSASPRPIALAQARSMSVQEDSGSVPIAAGENAYTVRVQISWEISQ